MAKITPYALISELNTTLVSCLGDSITAPNSVVTSGGISWVEIMCAVTKARIRYPRDRNYAVSGLTSTQVKDQKLPLALADDSKYVALMAGANNVSQTAIVIADIQFMVDRLILSGKTPILSTMTPNINLAGASLTSWYDINSAIREIWRADDRIIGVDLAIATSVLTPATASTAPEWKTNYDSGDGIHPDWIGIWAMGAYAGDILQSSLHADVPGPSATGDFEAEDAGEFGNPLMIGDTGFIGGAGAGDLFTYGHDDSSSAGDSVFAKVARTDGIQGEWQTATAGAANGLRSLILDRSSGYLDWDADTNYWVFVEVLYASSGIDTLKAGDAIAVFELYNTATPVYFVSAHVPAGSVLYDRHVIYGARIPIGAEDTSNYRLKIKMAPYTTASGINIGRIWREKE